MSIIDIDDDKQMLILYLADVLIPRYTLSVLQRHAMSPGRGYLHRLYSEKQSCRIYVVMSQLEVEGLSPSPTISLISTL